MVLDYFVQFETFIKTPFIMDLLLPFILFFALFYSALDKIEFLKTKGSKLAVALAITLGIVIPHITNSYPKCFDPINMMNAAFPKITFLILLGIGILVIITIFGGKDLLKNSLGIVSVIAILYVIYAVLSSIGGFVNPECAVVNFNLPSITTKAISYVLAIAMFVGIYWYITKD